MAALFVGALLLDVAMQSGMVANQARILSLRPEARGRVNTAYMTCGYLGGFLGSWLGTLVYSHLRWPGVCALLGALAGLCRHEGALRTMTAMDQATGATPIGSTGAESCCANVTQTRLV